MSWLSASFLKDATGSGVAGAWYRIEVTGLLAPGLCCSGPRSFQNQPIGSGTNCLSRKEAFVLTKTCKILAASRLRRAMPKCYCKLHLHACRYMRPTNLRTVSLGFWTSTVRPVQMGLV